MINKKSNNLNEIELPNSFLAEQAVLNILFNSPFTIKDVVPILKPNAFYFEPYKIIYELIVELFENKDLITLTVIITKLQDKGLIKKIGGINVIQSMISRYESFTYLDDYIEILNDKYYRRLLIEIGKQTIAWGYTTSLNVEEILEKINAAILNLGEKKNVKLGYKAVEIIEEIHNDLLTKVDKKILVSGYLTSFNKLDAILYGFKESDLIVVAGRPSMGKTAFALNLGKNIIEKYEVPLVIFTLEMSRQQIIYRLLSMDSKIESNRLKEVKMNQTEWARLTQSMKHISRLPIYIEDNPEISLLDMRFKLEQIFLKEKKKGIVIVDYIQLMKTSLTGENRTQEISYITRSLKVIAKELNVPIIALSQLSRGIESRSNKTPMLSDLRESGCLASLKELKKTNIYSGKKKSFTFPETIDFDIKGYKPTYSMKLKRKVKLELTSNHKILSKQGWVKISELNLNNNLPSVVKKSNEKINFSCKKIANLSYRGLLKVYDKEIPIYHNFLKKGIVLHNSIEQDADIVLMLYRDDSKDFLNNNSRNIDILVSKNRNGGLGSATLGFNPSFTTFENLQTPQPTP